MSNPDTLSQLISQWQQELQRELDQNGNLPEVEKRLELLQQMEKTLTQSPEGQSTDLIKPTKTDAQPSLGDVETMGSEQSLGDVDTMGSEESLGDVNTTDDTSPSTSKPTSPSSTEVHGYQIVRELGRGGMGVVYEAIQPELKRTVALKMILAGGHASESQLQRFRIEAEAVARLKHPNIVQIYEIGEQNGLPYFSLEFCEGGALNDRLNGTPWQEADAAKLMQTLATGMQAAHEAGVVHRDLKPHNVLLDANSTPKITDFGLAKRLEEAEGMTKTESVMGTPSYMAPEQAKGKTKEVGPAADVYSLGAMLYELLTGRPPFKAASAWDTIAQVINNEPVPPRQLNPKVSKDLEAICLKCLEKEPQKRYGSAETLAEDLRRFQAGEPIAARPLNAVATMIKWVKRRPTRAALAITSVAFLLTLGIGGPLVAIHQSSLKAIADKKTEEAQGLSKELKLKALELEDQLLQVQHSLFNNQLSRAAATYQRNPQQAYQMLHDYKACPINLRSSTWYHSANLCDPRRLILDSQDKELGTAITFNPNGDRLALASGKTITLWDVEARKVTATLKGHKDPVHSLCFSRDGSALALGTAALDPTGRKWTSQIILRDVVTGTVKVTLKDNPGRVVSMAFSADGKSLVTASDLTENGAGAPGELNAVAEVKVWDLAQARAKSAFKTEAFGIRSVDLSADGSTAAFVDGPCIKLWSTGTGREKRKLETLQSPFFQVAMSNDGKTVAATSPNTVHLYDVATGRKKRVLSEQKDLLYLSFSRDDKSLLTLSSDNTIRVWDMVSGQEKMTLKKDAYCLLALSHNGRALAVGHPTFVELWQPGRGEEKTTFEGHAAGVFSIAVADQNKTVASAGYRQSAGRIAGEIKLWDWITGEEKGTLVGHEGVILSVAFSPDGRALASASQDKTINLWDVQKRRLTGTLKGHAGWVFSVAYSPDGKTLASAGGTLKRTNGSKGVFVTGELKLWDTRTGKQKAMLKGHSKGVLSVSFSPDGSTMASCSTDKTIKLWDSANGKELVTLQGHSSAVSSVVFSSNGKLLASAGGTEIKLWDVKKQQEKATFQGRSNCASLTFSPDGRTLAAAGADKTITLWNIFTGQEQATLHGHSGALTSVVFTGDGEHLISSSRDGTSKVWDFKRNPHIATFKGSAQVTAIAFTMDGRIMKCMDRTQKTIYWDLSTGQRMTKIPKGAVITGAALSPDGRLKASAGQNGTIQLLDAKSGKGMATLWGHSKRVNILAFSPTGKALASASENGTIRLWDVASALQQNQEQ